jgi:hypothetical protein
MTQEAAMLVRITVRNEGGYFYAASPDLPGLHVCGETEEQVCESALTSVKVLFKRNRRLDVHVAPLTDDLEVDGCDLAAMRGVVVQRVAA